jgi:hypothetical protein
MIKYRENLERIGIDKNLRVNFSSGFSAFPRSLRQAIFAMNSPEPSKWFKRSEDKKSDKNYTNRCNGVATDGAYWYFTSNALDKQQQAIYKVDFSYNIKDVINLKPAESGHIGAVSYYQGKLYIACENNQQVLMIDTNSFDTFSQHHLLSESGGISPQRDKMAWCAIHPWNGLLYSSFFGEGDVSEVNLIFGYELKDGHFYNVPSATIHLKKPAQRVQGGAFTKNGNLLLSDDKSSEIKCYSSLNGHYWGATSVEVNRSKNVSEEMQGLCVSDNLSIDGTPTQIHLILLDADQPDIPYSERWPDRDDFFHKHYALPVEYDAFL